MVLADNVGLMKITSDPLKQTQEIMTIQGKEVEVMVVEVVGGGGDVVEVVGGGGDGSGSGWRWVMVVVVVVMEVEVMIVVVGGGGNGGGRGDGRGGDGGGGKRCHLKKLIIVLYELKKYIKGFYLLLVKATFKINIEVVVMRPLLLKY
ncbi:unnamed protein product [Prunus armeniaca]